MKKAILVLIVFCVLGTASVGITLLYEEAKLAESMSFDSPGIPVPPISAVPHNDSVKYDAKSFLIAVLVVFIVVRFFRR